MAAKAVGRFQTLLQRVLSHLTAYIISNPWLGPQGRRTHFLLGVKLSCESRHMFPQGDSSMENPGSCQAPGLLAWFCSQIQGPLRVTY